jgi:thiamine biosynthesis lipoprotein
MSEPRLEVFSHHAMATRFQVRLAGEDATYAAQAAQAAFMVLDDLESHLSRFRANSEIAQISELAPGEQLRLSEPVFACLEIAKEMELATGGAFSVTAAALQTQPLPPQWTLGTGPFAIRCDRGILEFDLGAVGKGFALDRMAVVLREWDCESFLLVAGGSSVLAGQPPAGAAGWSCGLAGDPCTRRYWLKNCSLSGSGVAVQGPHILDPRTGLPARRENRSWALAATAAESDALSTAAMVLDETEIPRVLSKMNGAVLWLQEGDGWKEFGELKLAGPSAD